MAHVPLTERLGPVRDAGFRGISVSIGDYLGLRRDGLSPAAIRDRIADAGLDVGDIECVGLWMPGQASVTGAWAEATATARPAPTTAKRSALKTKTGMRAFMGSPARVKT